MKTFTVLLFALLVSHLAIGQSIIGTWQLVEEKPCFQSEMKESETERELKESMGASRNAVAKMITFGKKGSYEEGILTQGKKKGSNVIKYNYQLAGQELQLLDKKSGMATQRFIIDELSATTLRFHNALKDCESKSFVRLE